MNTLPSDPASATPTMVRLDIDTVAPHFTKQVARLDGAATRELDDAQVEPGLRELIRIRASQLNGCTYCVDLHTSDALSGGEHPRRVAALPVWRESGLFTGRERAALLLTESMTLMSQTHVPESDWKQAATVFSPTELGAIVSLIVTINAWNALGVSTRAWTVSL